MERTHVVFLRVWISLAVAVDLIAIGSLFMAEGSTWAVGQRFALLLTVPAIPAYAWLHRRRKLVALTKLAAGSFRIQRSDVSQH